MACTKESVHIKIDKELYQRMEKMRILSYSKFTLARSDVYNEAIFYGQKIQELRRELGDKEFDRVWTHLMKINFRVVDIEKVI
jgi:hypothetical protein